MLCYVMLCVIYNLLSFCSIYLLSFRRFLHCCKAFPFYVNIYFRFRIWSSTKQSQITHDSKYNKGKFSERLCTTKILFESNCGFPNFFPSTSTLQLYTYFPLYILNVFYPLSLFKWVYYFSNGYSGKWPEEALTEF